MSTTSSKMMAFDTAKKSFDYVKCENGVLSVSSSGGTGGSASAENQDLQIIEAELTNSKLTTINSNILICKAELQASVIVQEATHNLLSSRLVKCDTSNTIIDSSTPVRTLLLAKVENTDNNAYLTLDDAQNLNVSIANQNDISGLATSANQESSNTAIYTKLGLIEQGTETNAGFLQSIDLKSTPLQQGIATYTLEAKSTLAPDTVPAYSAPPSGIDASEGWYYKNLALGNVSQLYYYGNNATQTKNHDYTISAIESQWAVVRILNLNAETSIPFLVVYSQPQGSGDIIPGFARSSWVYQVATGQDLRLGEKVLIYRGTEPDLRIFPELRRIECTLTVTRGPALTSELLAYGTVNSDSSAPINTVEYIISGAGLTFAGDNVYKVELTGENSVVSAGDASASNQVSSNTAICSRLDNSNIVLGDVKNELIALNATYGDLIDGTNSIYVKIDGTDDAIQIWGYNPVLDMPEAIYSTDHAIQAYITNSCVTVSGTVGLAQGAQVNLFESVVGLVENSSITVDNFPTDYSLEETQLAIKAKTDNLTFVDVDTNTGNLKVIDLANNEILSNLSFFTNEDAITDLRVNVQNIIEVRNPETEHLSVTESAPITSIFAKLQDSSENGISSTASEANGNVLNTRIFAYDLANDVTREVRMGENRGLFVENITEVDFEVVAKNDVKIINADGTSLDVHCFGSSDGTTFHHLKTTATGELVTHSQTRDGSGTAITSTVNGTVTALDVAISGVPEISGIVSAKSQDAFMPSVIENQNISGPVQMGTVVDIQGYLWVSAIMKFSSVTAGGNIYLEVSPDGSNLWARPSGAQVFITTTVTNVTASILLSSPVSMRYVRLWADTGFIGISGTAYVCCK